MWSRWLIRNSLNSTVYISSDYECYFYNLKTNHLMGGVNLYVARELNPWFYLDLQGDLGMAKNKFRDATNDKKYNFLYMGIDRYV